LVGVVITLTSPWWHEGHHAVRPFKYWAKMFAISGAGIVLMAVYGDYGKQISHNSGIANGLEARAFRRPLPEKAPRDLTWVSPFGPLTTKAAKAAATALTNQIELAGSLPLRPGLAPEQRITANETDLTQVLAIYSELTGRIRAPKDQHSCRKHRRVPGRRLSRWHWMRPASPAAGIQYHADGLRSARELKENLEAWFRTHDILIVPENTKYFWLSPPPVWTDRMGGWPQPARCKKSGSGSTSGPWASSTPTH